MPPHSSAATNTPPVPEEQAAEVAVVVLYKVRPGHGDEVAALLSRHTAATRQEPGCRDFVALRAVDDPDAFVLYERYVSPAAFEAHQASPHFEKFVLGQIRPLLDDRVLERFQLVPPAPDASEASG